MPTQQMTREEEFEEFRRSRYPNERSRELAQRAFAEKRGETYTPAQAEELATKERWGAPKAEGSLRVYTDPTGGFTRTYRADGGLLSEGTREDLTSRYTPYDQRKIQKLYQDRSRIATDPELEESARQQALDQLDQDIRSVPMVAPIMRQPTPQEKFNASIVTAPDGQRGTINRQGNFTPLELNKADVEAKKAYQETLGKNLESMMKANETALEPKDIDTIIANAQTIAGITHGFQWHQDFGKPLAPNLKEEWAAAMSSVMAMAGTVGKDKKQVQATEEQMNRALAQYIEGAVAKGYSQELAAVDFLDRWNKEAKRDTLGLIPELPDYLKQQLALGKVRLSAGLAKSPFDLATERLQQSYAKVNGKEYDVSGAPVMRMSVGKGVPVKDVVPPGTQQGRVQVKDKNGRIGTIPASELQEALNEGFSLVE